MLRAEGLTKRFRTAERTVTVLDGVDLTLRAELRLGSAELADLDTAQEGPPLSVGERQDGPSGILGVAHRNPIGQFGDLEAMPGLRRCCDGSCTRSRETHRTIARCPSR